MGKTARISIRVNPDVDSGTHAKISTGKSENKFGIPLARAREVYARAAKLPGHRVTGVDVHIGSQITDLGPMEAAFRMLPISSPCCAATATASPTSISAAASAFPITRTATAPPEPLGLCRDGQAGDAQSRLPLMFEPGRMIVGNAGILVSRVIYVKHGDGKNFVIIDAAMNDLIRPTLYEAYHDILPVATPRAGRWS